MSSIFEVLPSPSEWQGSAYRNVYTVSPSQTLLDDLISDPKDFKVAVAWEEITGEIEKGHQYYRPIEYGDKGNSLFVFENNNPGVTRFSDGTFGVWYGALEEETSFTETLFWLFREVQPDLPNSKNGIIRKHRRMFLARLDHVETIDLVKLQSEYPNLTHPTDYSLCHELGMYAVDRGIGLYLAPSARKEEGIRTPVFQKEAIKGDTYRYDYYLTFKAASRRVVVERKGKISHLNMPREWQDI